MKTKVLFSRHNLLWIIILCYLIPLVSLLTYNTFADADSKDWNTLSIGLFVACIGSLALFWLMTSLEGTAKIQRVDITNDIHTEQKNSSVLPETRPTVDPEEHLLAKLSLEEAQRTQERLLTEIDTLTDEIKRLSTGGAQERQNTEKARRDAEQLALSTSQQLEQQQFHIRQLQDTIAEQKASVEKKHQQTSLLETKVADLTYEIKTLLQFAEAYSGPLLSSDPIEPVVKTEVQHEYPNEAPQKPQEIPPHESGIKNSQEASHQLKRCIDISQKITGSQRFGSQLYSFSDSPAGSFALDLRRLCDRLRSESTGTILLYSPKENQILFASNQIKELTGWSPEKFTQNFKEIVDDETLWKQGVNSLAMRSEAHVSLPLKTRSGQTVNSHANLGMIPTGIFRDHVIAVLYAST